LTDKDRERGRLTSGRTRWTRLVKERDNYTCQCCGHVGQKGDGTLHAHHILDRSLFDNGGYFIANGVSLCSFHHLEAEKTRITCEDLRQAAGIMSLCMPEHLYVDENYDHWGNIILPNKMRLSRKFLKKRIF
jgi:predicted restriction endonuclease